jgi:hypothetical protein
MDPYGEAPSCAGIRIIGTYLKSYYLHKQIVRWGVTKYYRGVKRYRINIIKKIVTIGMYVGTGVGINYLCGKSDFFVVSYKVYNGSVVDPDPVGS